MVGSLLLSKGESQDYEFIDQWKSLRELDPWENEQKSSNAVTEDFKRPLGSLTSTQLTSAGTGQSLGHSAIGSSELHSRLGQHKFSSVDEGKRHQKFNTLTNSITSSIIAKFKASPAISRVDPGFNKTMRHTHTPKVFTALKGNSSILSAFDGLKSQKLLRTEGSLM